MTSGRPLRCAQIVETLAMGGAENLAVGFANELAARGHESHLVAIEAAGPLRSRLSSDVIVHEPRIRRASVRNPLAFGYSILDGLRRLERIVGRGGIRIVQTHLPGANFWGLLLTLRGAARVVATVHNNEEFNYGDPGARVRQRLRRSAYRRIVRSGAATIAVSDAVKASLLSDLELAGKHADRIRVIPNGVPVAKPLGEAGRRQVRDRFGIPGDVPCLVAAGRHCEQKNFRDLVTAGDVLRRQGHVFQLVIAGEGPLTRDLEAQIADLGIGDVVFLPGNVDDLPQLLAAADIFVMPSLWEGLPLVLLEAMAAGLPVVGSRIHGLVDVVEDGREGLLVEPGAPKRMAEALATLLGDEERRRRMGGAGRDLVESRYGFPVTVDRVEELYRELAGASR